MTGPREFRQCNHRSIGRRVIIFDSLGSTNDYALDHGQPGDAIVTDVQTAGRGQHGRVWQSRPEQSLLLSVVVPQVPELARPVAMIAWAAVAVAEAIYSLSGHQARIKWPNDLLLGGRKVSGILTERRGDAVVGIGLNLSQSQDDLATLPDATSLAINSGTSVDRDTSLNAVLEALDAEYSRLVAGERLGLESDWKWRIGLLGRQVKLELTDGTTLSGRLKELSFDAIELETQAVAPERIRQMSEARESLARGPAERMIQESRPPECTHLSRPI